MNAYDICLTTGKSFRMLDPDADSLAEIMQAQRAKFGDELLSVSRVIPPIPDKLPWKRCEGGWQIGRFRLTKGDGDFTVSWPGGSVTGGKDEVSAAVRNNWALGC